MTKAIYMGVDGVARKAKAMYVGVDDVARKVKKAYVGDANGVAKLFYQSDPLVSILLVVKDGAGEILSGVNVRINKTKVGVTDVQGSLLLPQQYKVGTSIEITLDSSGYEPIRVNKTIEQGNPFQIDVTMIRDVQIIFDTDGGSAISRIDTYQGAIFNSFPTPAKVSYVFKGWYLDDVPVVYPFTVLSNTTLTAKWEEELKQYNITIDYDEGGNVTTSHESAAYAGEELLFSAQPKIGFIFSKWEIYLEGNSIPEIKTDNPLTYIMPASDINFVPIFAEEGGGTGITYNIMMGIAIGGSASSNKDTAAEGEQVTFTAMPDVGSEFLNWEIMKDGETTPAIIIDNPLTYTMPACNIGVTPVFNEGSPPVPSDPITLVFKVTGTDSPPTGYTVRFTYPDGSLIFEGTTKALGTVRMNTADCPMYAVDGMTSTATNGSYAGTITINAADVTEDKANPSSEILFDIPVITTGTLGSSNAKDAKTTITIPAGVNVIKFKDVYIGVTPNKTYNISKKSFALGSEFRLSVSSDTEGYWRETVYTTTVFNELTLSFEYSPAINSVTPTVTDY